MPKGVSEEEARIICDSYGTRSRNLGTRPIGHMDILERIAKNFKKNSLSKDLQRAAATAPKSTNNMIKISQLQNDRTQIRTCHFNTYMFLFSHYVTRSFFLCKRRRGKVKTKSA